MISRITRRRLCSAGAVIAVFLLLATVVRAERPNVVLIMADDLGYHDLGCYGHPRIETPVLDRLAEEGIRLTSFYAGATVCTPSRMAVLTGAYPTRLGWERGVVGHRMEPKTGLHPDALTMAEVFQRHGYRTAIAGKWHVGDEPAFLPRRQGFDRTFYITRSHNQTKKLWQGDALVADPLDDGRLTEQFIGEAIRFVRDARGTPFFLYIPLTAPHFPVVPHPDWEGHSDYGALGDVVEEMDFRIGQLLDVLDQEQLASRTLVVFLSDNGPEGLTKASKADPYRGGKWTALEGGTRVPCMVRWPGVIPAGQESDAIVAAIDLLPTLCRACGIELADVSRGRPVIDGLDVWETLTGRPGAVHPRKDLLYWHGADGFHAIRVGPWKLFPRGKDALPDGTGGPALFNLADDPRETRDLSGQFPERVRAMQKLADERLAEIHENSMPLGR